MNKNESKSYFNLIKESHLCLVVSDEADVEICCCLLLLLRLLLQL